MVDLVIYSWTLPTGGLLNVILEEFTYFKERGYDVRVLFYHADPLSFQEDTFRKLDPIVITQSFRSSNPLKIFAERTSTYAFKIPIYTFFKIPKILLRDRPFVIAHEVGSGLTTFLYSLLISLGSPGLLWP